MSKQRFNKSIKEITGKDRYVYETMTHLPDGVILIDLNDDRKTRYGKITLSQTAINNMVRFTKEIVKERLVR